MPSLSLEQCLPKSQHSWIEVYNGNINRGKENTTTMAKAIMESYYCLMKAHLIF